MIDFGEWLERQRGDKEWTQAQLARRAGISQSAISLVVSGARKPGVDFASAIARALKLPEEDVLRLAGLLPPVASDLSPEKRKLIKLAETASDQAVEMAIAMLEAAEKNK